jgi:hypothetical protein
MRRLLTILTSDQHKVLTGKIHFIIFDAYIGIYFFIY